MMGKRNTLKWRSWKRLFVVMLTAPKTGRIASRNLLSFGTIDPLWISSSRNYIIVSWGCLGSNHSSSLNMMICSLFLWGLWGVFLFSPFLESFLFQQPTLTRWFEMVQVGRFRLYLEQLFSLCPVELWCQTCWRHVIFTSNHFLDGMHIEMINLLDIMFCFFGKYTDGTNTSMVLLLGIHPRRKWKIWYHACVHVYIYS